MSNRCNSCGTDNPSGAKFCKVCGAAMSGQANAVTPPKKKRKKTGLIIGIVAAAIAAGLIFTVFIPMMNSRRMSEQMAYEQRRREVMSQKSQDSNSATVPNYVADNGGDADTPYTTSSTNVSMPEGFEAFDVGNMTIALPAGTQYITSIDNGNAGRGKSFQIAPGVTCDVTEVSLPSIEGAADTYISEVIATVDPSSDPEFYSTDSGIWRNKFVTYEYEGGGRGVFIGLLPTVDNKIVSVTMAAQYDSMSLINEKLPILVDVFKGIMANSVI